MGSQSPLGTLCPLPHYLLFIWCFLESWYWSDHRLVWGVSLLSAGRKGGGVGSYPRNRCGRGAAVQARLRAEPGVNCLLHLCVQAPECQLSVALQQEGSGGPKSFFKVYVTVVSQAVRAASLQEILGHQNGSSFLSNPDFQGPTPWGGDAAALPHISDGRAFSSRVLEMLTGSGGQGPTGCHTCAREW